MALLYATDLGNKLENLLSTTLAKIQRIKAETKTNFKYLTNGST